MSGQKGIRVTVEDLETGDIETTEIRDDWVVVTAGRYSMTNVMSYPKSGTAVVTIKRVSL